MELDLTPFFLSLKLSFITTVLLLLIGIPLSYFIAYTEFRLKPIVEAVITLPLILPPTVLGFYLLILFSKNGFLGSLWEKIAGHQLSFHFEGLVFASIIFSFPFMIHPLISGFRSVNRSIIEAAYTLGKSRLKTLFYVILPNMKPAVITGIVLSFAHTLGEFGVVLMIGGSIDGETKVVSIAIYEAVEKLDYTSAHIYAGILLGFSFFTLLTVYLLNKKYEFKG
ncbi:molybdate ABC transporter permease subunit [Persephonella sp.]